MLTETIIQTPETEIQKMIVVVHVNCWETFGDHYVAHKIFT